MQLIAFGLSTVNINLKGITWGLKTLGGLIPVLPLFWNYQTMTHRADRCGLICSQAGTASGLSYKCGLDLIIMAWVLGWHATTGPVLGWFLVLANVRTTFGKPHLGRQRAIILCSVWDKHCTICTKCIMGPEWGQAPFATWLCVIYNCTGTVLQPLVVCFQLVYN